MISTPTSLTTRRDFIKTTGTVAAVSALAGTIVPHVHAASTDTIHVALIGCGGRGGGAADNALSVNTGPMKLVAMADVFLIALYVVIAKGVGLATVEIAWGMYLFTGLILVSLFLKSPK